MWKNPIRISKQKFTLEVALSTRWKRCEMLCTPVGIEAQSGNFEIRIWCRSVVVSLHRATLLVCIITAKQMG